MPNNYLSVLYQHIIQVENKNVGLKVEGHKHTIAGCVWPRYSAKYSIGKKSGDSAGHSNLLCALGRCLAERVYIPKLIKEGNVVIIPCIVRRHSHRIFHFLKKL